MRAMAGARLGIDAQKCQCFVIAHAQTTHQAAQGVALLNARFAHLDIQQFVTAVQVADPQTLHDLFEPPFVSDRVGRRTKGCNAAEQEHGC